MCLFQPHWGFYIRAHKRERGGMKKKRRKINVKSHRYDETQTAMNTSFASLSKIHLLLTIGRWRVLGNRNAEIGYDIEYKPRASAKGKRMKRKE